MAKNFKTLLSSSRLLLLGILFFACKKTPPVPAANDKSLHLKPSGIGHLSEAKSLVAAAVVRDTVYIFGGNYGIGAPTTSNRIEMFDIKTRQTSVLPRTINGNFWDGNCAVVGDNIYLFGEVDIHIFNTYTKTIQTLTNKLTTFQNPQAVAVDDKIYLFAGVYPDGGGFFVTSQKILIFNTKNASITELPFLMPINTKQSALRYKVVTLLGKMYAVPTDIKDTDDDRWRAFDPATNITSLIPSDIFRLSWPGVAVLNDKCFIFGGYKYKPVDEGTTDEIIAFDPISQKKDILNVKSNQKKQQVTAVSTNDKIIVIGGKYPGSFFTDDIEVFDAVYE